MDPGGWEVVGWRVGGRWVSITIASNGETADGFSEGVTAVDFFAD